MNYGERRAALIEYLKSKTQEADWHAVSDAANDLRVMEAKGPAATEPLSAREHMLREASAAAFRAMDNRKSPIAEKPYPTCKHGFDWAKGFRCLDCARGR